MGLVLGASIGTVVPAGIERGSVFPETAGIGEYFYREDIDILFAKVIDYRLMNQETMEWGRHVWTAVESFSNNDINIYAASDGETSSQNLDCGYSPDHPTSCMFMVEHLIPKTSRGGVNIYVDGFVGADGDPFTAAFLKIRARYIGRWSGGSLSFNQWTDRSNKVTVPVSSTTVTCSGAHEAVTSTISRVPLDDASALWSSVWQFWTSEGLSFLGTPDSPTSILVPTGNMNDTSVFTDGTVFHCQPIDSPASALICGANVSLRVEGNFSVSITIPISQVIDIFGTNGLWVTGGTTTIRAYDLMDTVTLSGVGGGVELKGCVSNMNGLYESVSLAESKATIEGVYLRGAMTLTRSDVITGGQWFIKSAGSTGVTVNRWSSFEFWPFGESDVIGNHIVGFDSAYSVDQTVSNGIILGV